MGLTIAYSKIKNRNLVFINNDTYQRETVSEQPIRQPLRLKYGLILNGLMCISQLAQDHACSIPLFGASM